MDTYIPEPNVEADDVYNTDALSTCSSNDDEVVDQDTKPAAAAHQLNLRSNHFNSSRLANSKSPPPPKRNPTVSGSAGRSGVSNTHRVVLRSSAGPITIDTLFLPVRRNPTVPQSAMRSSARAMTSQKMSSLLLTSLPERVRSRLMGHLILAAQFRLI